MPCQSFGNVGIAAVPLKYCVFLFFSQKNYIGSFLFQVKKIISEAVRLSGNCIIEGLNGLLGGGNKAREDTISL